MVFYWRLVYEILVLYIYSFNLIFIVLNWLVKINVEYLKVCKIYYVKFVLFLGGNFDRFINCM